MENGAHQLRRRGAQVEGIVGEFIATEQWEMLEGVAEVDNDELEKKMNSMVNFFMEGTAIFPFIHFFLFCP